MTWPLIKQYFLKKLSQRIHAIRIIPQKNPYLVLFYTAPKNKNSAADTPPNLPSLVIRVI